MKNKSYKWIWLIGGIVLAAILVLYCYFGPVNRIFFHLFTDYCDSPEEGLGSDVTSTYYINGVRALVLADTEDPEADIKQVFYERAFTRLVNFTEGRCAMFLERLRPLLLHSLLHRWLSLWFVSWYQNYVSPAEYPVLFASFCSCWFYWQSVLFFQHIFGKKERI